MNPGMLSSPCSFVSEKIREVVNEEHNTLILKACARLLQDFENGAVGLEISQAMTGNFHG